MNALLMAIVVTLIAVLDYFWPHIEGQIKDESRARKIKFSAVGVLLVFAWIQAAIQFRRDSDSDRDMNYLKEQLASANSSLTNSTAVVRGLTTGGDSTAEFTCCQSRKTNALDIAMETGDYPLRALYVKVQDETKRLNRDRKITNSEPQNVVLFERSLGDVPGKAFQQICTDTLNPAITNFIRFDVSALNGSCWQVWAVTKSNSNWCVRLNYRWSQIGGKLNIDPPERRDVIMIDD